MKRKASLTERSRAGLQWSEGDYYVPGLAHDSRTGLVPGAPDTHRRRFLERAAEIEPELLDSLRAVSPEDKHALRAWSKRWHLTDEWCLVLAHDTVRWWASEAEARGWEFKSKGIFIGMFPFRIPPLTLESFYYDPTWRRRGDFKRYVQDKVSQALDPYCDRIEADALAAGLKRSPRKREVGHFDWLVRYQIKSESFASIARDPSYKFNGGRQTVRKAVVELAEYLSLKLRPSTS